MLYLNGNPIGDAGATKIAVWLLKGDQTLEELYLKGEMGKLRIGKDGARAILKAMEVCPKLKKIDMSGNDFPGSETCVWTEGTGISRDEFIEKQLAILDGSVPAGDGAMDDGEENSEDKNPKNVDLELSKTLADLPQSVGRNFTEKPDNEVTQIDEEEGQGNENFEDKASENGDGTNGNPILMDA